MDKQIKVFVAGSSGLVGSALVSLLRENSMYQVIATRSKDLNLLDRDETFKYIDLKKPDLIIDAAAKVGGIMSNNTFPSDFISQNLQIQTNLIDAAINAQVEKFVFLGSTCIYPRNCPQPIKEDYLMTGPLEETNSAYAVAKIAGIESVKAVRKQFGLNWISLMPTNVYGPNDNFDLKNSHVLPALIRKFIEAKDTSAKNVEIWGDGSPLREFIHSRDLAEAIIVASNNYSGPEHLNIGTGEEISIKELVELIANLANYKGEIIWNSKMPNGTPRKVVDISKITALGWKPKISLESGIESTLKWFRENKERGLVRL